jgi:membrane protease YdiL (CAAX protease family)
MRREDNLMPRIKKGSASHERPMRYAVYVAFLALIVLLLETSNLYATGKLGENAYLVYASIAQSFIFSFVVLAYLFASGRSLRQALARLGLARKQWKSAYIAYGIAIFVSIFILEILLGVFQAVTGVQLPTNVAKLFSGLPFYFLLFSVFIAPINEEILFRGFLVPGIGNVLLSGRKNARRGTAAYKSAMWAGIILSALLFGVLHYLSYNSISELIAALVFGLIAGYVRIKKDSLYPSIIAHMLVNFLGLLVLAILI